jgi:CDP-6-deoxy-D-xylo-4-hexulose-3-dehydrase
MAAVKTLLGEWLVLGAEAIKFERKFPKLFGKEYGLLTNSGSSANLLMMLAMTSKRGYNMPKGTKVITPIAGFPTTINPIIQLGFVPIFVDIELKTLNLDLNQVEQACIDNPDAKIITFAHVLGNPPDMNRLMEIVKKYKLILLEDCCDALGSTFEGKPLGSFGDMASCSFYPAHHMTMGEGGFVAMNDQNTERIVRSFREWGRGCYCVGKQNLLENGACKCRFSNWSDKEEMKYTTDRRADPRSFCIQKTLQNIAHSSSVENELMFSGHNAYRFATDDFYKNGFIPTVKELIKY